MRDDSALPVGVLVGEVPQEERWCQGHVLYDLEAQVPAFYHITTASVNDSKAMQKSLTDKTPLRELFDKTYSNDVKE